MFSLRTTSSVGFLAQIVEPSGGHDPDHLSVDITYMAVERGVHGLPDGSVLIADIVDTNAQQFGLNGVTNDQTLFNLYLMRSIAGGTATELTSAGVEIKYNYVELTKKGAFSLEQSTKPGRVFFIGARSFLGLGGAEFYNAVCR